MNINIIKDEVEKYLGKNVILKQNIGRNKYETHKGVIDKIYPYLFTLKTENEIKSFSYADLLIKTIIIKIK